MRWVFLALLLAGCATPDPVVRYLDLRHGDHRLFMDAHHPAPEDTL